MIDVLILATNGCVRVYLPDVSWLQELAVLRAIIGRPIAIYAVSDRGDERGKWWHMASRDGKT